MSQKFLITSIIILVTLFNAPFGNSQQSEQTKNILILFGLSPGQPAYRPILDGIRQKLTIEFGDLYNLHTEYLEIESYPKDYYPKNRFDIYNNKYREIKLELLIVVGRNAVNVIKNKAENFLLYLPAISIDFDFSNYGYNKDLRLNEKTVVVGLKFEIDKMISTALSVLPSTASIYFIGGTSPFDSFMMSIAKIAAQKVDKNKKVAFLTDLSMDEILKQVRHLPHRSIIFIPSFNTDNKSVTYYNNESIRLISTNANSPVFSYSDVGFGDGAVGGYILSFNKVGFFSGDFAVKILKGANPNSISVTEKDYYEYVFDWRQLKRWNLVNSDLIPAGSTIMYEDISFVDQYKWIGGIVLMFLILQSLLIANLFRLNRNQKIMTQKIIETEDKYRDFLREDRILRMGQLTASLSHELNQPLTAILSNAQAGINFINSNDATPDLLKEIFQKIVDNDKRGASILQSIRGMIKLESREKGKTNLNELINEVAAVFQSEADKLNTKLNLGLTDKTVYVLADRIQIQQVLLNFLLNASQSMEKIDVSHKEIIVSSTINNSEVIVSVRDRGPGIEEEMKEKLFNPFATSKKEGTGIGLAICRAIIEDHSGKIWAENIPDGGAKFSFSLKII